MELIKINNTTLEFNKIVYVDAANGNDTTGDGSKNNPYNTVAQALHYATSGDAVFIKKGQYVVDGMHTFFNAYGISFIGDIQGSEIILTKNINGGQYVSSTENKYYRLIFTIGPNFASLSADARFILWYNASVAFKFAYYNCIFRDPFSQLSDEFLVFDGSSYCNPVFYKGFANVENCLFLGSHLKGSVQVFKSTTGCNILIKNCAYDTQQLRSIIAQPGYTELVDVTTIGNVFVNGKYSITSEGWQNTGTGLNPDGTQANIGVYGGEFAWEWLPQPIDNISYSISQKSIGDTILINWDESYNATRYELQYYINNEWITINNNITDTEYEYTFEQANSTAQFRVKGINSNGESDWVVGEVFEVANQSSIDGGITINPQNKMRGYIDIIGMGDSNLNSSLVIRQAYEEELDSTINISKKYEKPELDSSMVVAQRDFSTLDSSIALNPSGRMRGFVDIVQPPKKVKKIYPIKDSVVRQSAPTINYGDSQQMLAGESKEGKFISYLGFDLELPDNIDIESIKLVLHKQYDTPRRFLMGLYEISDDWDEYDITWSFRSYDEGYITQFPIPMEAGRVEADLTDFEWVEGKKSFIIRPRNYAFSELTAFGTRESLAPPYIEVTYYEIVNNVGSYSLESNITVRSSSKRDISASIDVQSSYVYSKLDGLLEIEEKQGRKELEGSILVIELRYIDIGGGLEIEKKFQKAEIDSFIIIPYRTFLESSIEIERKDKEDNLNSILIIRAYTEEDLDVILDIEGKNKDSELDSSITIKRDNDEDLETELVIENKYNDINLNSSIVVARVESKYLDSTLSLERKDKEISIDVGLIVQRKEDIDLDSSIEIPRYDKNTEIDSSIYILHHSDIESSIEIPKVDSQEEINSSMEIPEYT